MKKDRHACPWCGSEKTAPVGRQGTILWSRCGSCGEAFASRWEALQTSDEDPSRELPSPFANAAEAGLTGPPVGQGGRAG